MVVPFVECVVAVGHSGKVLLQQLHGRIHMALFDENRKVAGKDFCVVRLFLDVVGEQAFEKADTYFLVRKVECVGSDFRVVVLDGQIAALIE